MQELEELDILDILIIGSGESGKYLGWTMAKAGHRVAVVERKLIGGACPNIACLPSKNIIHSAKVASLAARGAEFGLAVPAAGPSMRQVQRRKQKMVAELIQVQLDRYQASGCELIMGWARLVGGREVEVTLNDGGMRRLRGKHLCLDLGTSALVADTPGLREAQPLTHVEALDLSELPEHLVVLGGGYVGLELAQAFRRLGARITIIERGPQLAAREDADVGAALEQLMRDEGIEVLLDTAVVKVEGRSGQGVHIHVEDARGVRVLEASDLLAATGRVPNTRGIGLEEAGVRLDERGYIQVNERLETTAQNVWAMGDCAGSPMFTHVAFDDFRVVRDNLNGGNRTTKDRLIPYCLFTDPELAAVGLNEKEARQRGIAYRLVKTPMAAVLRTRTISETRGFVKMLIDAKSDTILGFTAFGAEASEMMAAVQTAMLGNLPYVVLRDAIFTHPTMAEGLTVLLADVPGRAREEGA